MPAQDIATSLAHVNRPLLERVVRGIVGDFGAELANVTVTELDAGAGNPTTDGVWRIAGNAATAAGKRPWSVVLKVAVLPDDVATDHADNQHFNYWCREVDILNSPLLSDLPAAMKIPTFYGADFIEQRRAWIWLEDLGSDESAWTVAAYEFVARQLAVMQRPYLSETPLPSYAWLNADVPRRWWELLEPYRRAVLDRALAGYEPLRWFNPESTDTDLVLLMELNINPEPLLLAIDRLPVTFCHSDPNPNNIRLQADATGDPTLVLFDWQLAGLGGVGTDLSQLLCNVPAVLGGLERVEVERRVVDAYFDELTKAGADVTRDQVEFGYSASAILRRWTFNVAIFGSELEQTIETAGEATVAEQADGLIGSVRASSLPRLASRAMELASQLR